MPERNVTLTCETKGCPSEKTPIVMFTDAQQYMCGACGEFITNAVDVVEEITDGTDQEAI